MLVMADRYGAPKLKEKALEMIAKKKKDIVKLDKWKSFNHREACRASRRAHELAIMEARAKLAKAKETEVKENNNQVRSFDSVESVKNIA